MRQRTRILSVLGGLALFASLNAGATTLVPMTLPEITQLSNDIVVGSVSYQVSAYDPVRKEIRTKSYIAVDRYLKSSVAGTGNPYVVVEEPGGKVGSKGQHVAGAPGLQAGDKAILFLQSRDSGTKGVLGFSQGVVRVESGTDSGKEDTVVGTLAVEDSGGVSKADGNPGREIRTFRYGYQEFTALVEGLVEIQALKQGGSAGMTR